MNIGNTNLIIRSKNGVGKRGRVMASRYTHNLILRMKRSIFNDYWILYVFGALFVLAFCNSKFSTTEPYVTVIGGVFALLFFLQKHKLDEAKYLTEIFSKFNERYDNLNDILSTIKNDDVPLTEEQKRKLVDYFNLCAEEFLIFKQGYIPLEVWKSWMLGVNQYWQIQKVKEKWESELTTNSYYDFIPAKEIEMAQKL